MRFLCASMCVLLLGSATLPAQQQTLTDGIAVLVNDAIITIQDVYIHSRSVLDLLSAQYRDRPEMYDKRATEVKADATEQLVERQLILADFKAAGYNLPESIIEDSIQERIKSQYGDRVTLMQTLHAQNVTYETFHQQRREEIIIEVMRRRNLNQDIVISPQRILNYYEEHKTNFTLGDQVKLRMIVINKQANDNGMAKQLATEILQKIKEGASFREMAKIHSDGAQRANEGDWGWAERSTLRPELSDIAFKLKKGERSGVVDLNDSCWLIQVEDVRPAHIRPLAEVQDEIERTLRQSENERMRKKWVARLKSKALVQYF